MRAQCGALWEVRKPCACRTVAGDQSGELARMERWERSDRELGILERLRQASGDPRGSHTERPGSEMERMETGTVWLTLKVPLTLSPH